MFRPKRRYGKPSFSRGQKSFSGKNNAKHSEFSDVFKFIKKAEPVAQAKPYVAKNQFNDFCIDERIKKNIAVAKYTSPTPIQDQAIGQILQGRDLVGIANTGTGKTAAFLIPLIDKVVKNPRQSVLIVAPTRELAVQINEELTKLSFGLSIFSACIVGGMPMGRQIKQLRYRNHFIVGTSGRINDLVKRGNIRLENFQTIVLDEADRMLDMGFINDMRFLISGLPKRHQTLLFSATLSNDIKKLIGEFLNNPVNVSVRTSETANGVNQDVVYVRNGSKIDILHNLLLKPEFEKVIIFGRTKHGVQRLSNMLNDRGHKSQAIHGNKNYKQRLRALDEFRENRSKILVATDVASRGLDIPNVSHVINYELPATHEDYIHRIGRTGRAGKTGQALTFIG